jgi:hypothetical protein
VNVGAGGQVAGVGVLLRAQKVLVGAFGCHRGLTPVGSVLSRIYH